MTLTLALAFILFYKGQINVLQAFSILWGNILSLTFWDLVVVVATSLFVIAIVFFFFKEIQAILYDREIALAVGLPEKRLYYLIVFVLGITIAVSMRLDRSLTGRCLCPLAGHRCQSRGPESQADVSFVILFRRRLRDGRALSVCRGGCSGQFHDHPGSFSHHWGLYVLWKEVSQSMVEAFRRKCVLLNSKHEIRNSKQILNSNTSNGCEHYVFEPSTWFRISIFGFRILKPNPKYTRLIFALILLAGIAGQVTAQTVVASTSLTGAIAKAAGASEVRILTPAGAKHPPEYELKPSDLLKLEGANVVLYAGYERMVSRLAETSKNKNLVAIQVNTVMSPDNIIAQTRKVAAALHTETQQQLWEKSFMEKLNGLKTKLAPFAGKSAVVHLQAQPFARWAGLSVVQVISPGELSPKAMTEAIGKNPDIVVDILHFPVARVIADNARSRYAQLINFPGVDNTATLDDVFEYNTLQIVRAFQGK